MRGQKTKGKIMKNAPIFLGAIAVIVMVAIAGFLAVSTIPETAVPTQTTGTGIVSIGIPSHSPSSPLPTDTVTITVKVSDPEGIGFSSVTLWYKIAGIEYHVAMSGALTRTATIPAQPSGTVVSYWCIVAFSGGSDTSSTKSYTVQYPPTSSTTTTTTTTEPDYVSYALTVFDSDGNNISDIIHSATIRGTISFQTEVLSGSSRVYGVKLDITGLSANTTALRTYHFVQNVINPAIWTLQLDTTQLNNGEYLFDFILLIYQAGYDPGVGGDPQIYELPFSSFTFGMSDEGGSFLIAGIPLFYIVVIILIGTGIAGSTVYYLTRPKRRRRS